MPLYLVNVTYAVEAKSEKAAEAIVEAVCVDTTGVLNATDLLHAYAVDQLDARDGQSDDNPRRAA